MHLFRVILGIASALLLAWSFYITHRRLTSWRRGWM